MRSLRNNDSSGKLARTGSSHFTSVKAHYRDMVMDGELLASRARCLRQIATDQGALEGCSVSRTSATGFPLLALHGFRRWLFEVFGLRHDLPYLPPVGFAQQEFDGSSGFLKLLRAAGANYGDIDSRVSERPGDR